VDDMAEETQYCTLGKHYAPISSFYRRGKNDERKRSWCDDCKDKLIREKLEELKIEVLSHYSTLEFPICSICGEKDINKLCLDHVDGGGRDYLKSIKLYHEKSNKVKSGFPYYQWLKANSYPQDPRLQVLCNTCNRTKETVNGEMKRNNN
jgi:hypothetical protein